MLILVPTHGEAQALFEGRVPENEHPVATSVAGVRVRAALCGFGPAAAGVLAAIVLLRESPSRCLLAGMAGSFNLDRAPVGSLVEPAEVRITDVGRGQGVGFRGPHEFGFDQVRAGPGQAAVRDRLLLEGRDLDGVLLTVAAASASPEEAAGRRARHPEALIEDMEGFSVALACRRLGVPLRILRGVSNEVGEPERSNWEVEPALATVRQALASRLAASEEDAEA